MTFIKLQFAIKTIMFCLLLCCHYFCVVTVITICITLEGLLPSECTKFNEILVILKASKGNDKIYEAIIFEKSGKKEGVNNVYIASLCKT